MFVASFSLSLAHCLPLVVRSQALGDLTGSAVQIAQGPPRESPQGLLPALVIFRCGSPGPILPNLRSVIQGRLAGPVERETAAHGTKSGRTENLSGTRLTRADINDIVLISTSNALLWGRWIRRM